jgi:hypothetical protein
MYGSAKRSNQQAATLFSCEQDQGLRASEFSPSLFNTTFNPSGAFCHKSTIQL